MFNKKRVLVLGGNGMLGGAFLRKLSGREGIELATTIRGSKPTWDASVNCFSDVIFDVRSNFEFIEEFKPDYVLNCVGDVAKNNSEISNINQVFVNAMLPHLLAELAAKYNFHLVHFSTDCVFNGLQGPYNDFSKKCANDSYGQSKSLGEVTGLGITTVRTSIVGPEFDGGNRGLFEWFKAQNKTVEGFASAQYSGVSTNELSNIILALLLSDKVPRDILTIAGPKIDKFQLLNLFKDYLQKDIEIIRNTDFIIDRSLDDSRFREMFPNLRKKSWFDMIQNIERFDEFS